MLSTVEDHWLVKFNMNIYIWKLAVTQPFIELLQIPVQWSLVEVFDFNQIVRDIFCLAPANR